MYAIRSYYGVPAQTVKIARYAICATIDDVVLNTPWGGTGVWAQSSMVGTFHKETHGGERFYDLVITSYSIHYTKLYEIPAT